MAQWSELAICCLPPPGGTIYALVFGYAASWINSNWFVPGTIVGYWLSSVLGILMMQFGAMDMLVNDEKRNLKRDLLIGIGGSTLYTLVVAALAYFHVLEIPDFLVAKP